MQVLLGWGPEQGTQFVLPLLLGWTAFDIAFAASLYIKLGR